MKNDLRRFLTSALSAVFALGMAFPATAFASAVDADEPAATVVEPEMVPTDSQLTDIVEVTPSTESAPDDCTVTIRYYENATVDNPNYPVGDDGRLYLGQRVITGLHEGQVLNAWDYVENIPGMFFFDGWPKDLVVSTNPADNIITLTYGRLWNNSLTVNYYLMEGADLTADNWKDALAPDDVHFVKMGTETLDGLPAGMIINSDRFETPIESTYHVDSFPQSLEMSLDPEDNVLNILYTTDSANLPSDGPVAGEDNVEDPGPIDKDDLIASLPDDLPIEDSVIVGADGVVGADLAQTGDEAPFAIMLSIALAAIGIGAVALFAWRSRRDEETAR